MVAAAFSRRPQGGVLSKGFASAALAIALALCGCAGRPSGNLIPVAGGAPGAQSVDMLVATTRAEDLAPPGIMFSGERGRGLAFADIVVSIPPDAVRKIGEVQWPSSPPGDPAHDFVTLRAERIDLKQAKAEFDRRLRVAPEAARAVVRARLQHAFRGGGLSLRADRA